MHTRAHAQLWYGTPDLQFAGWVWMLPPLTLDTFPDFLSFSFLSSSRGIHPAFGRFSRIKSGPPRPDWHTGRPQELGAASIHRPGVWCHCRPCTQVTVVWPGQARPEAPTRGKGPRALGFLPFNLSFRTLSAPHNGPGDHSRPARHPQALHCWEPGSSFHCWEGVIFSRVGSHQSA